jgi:hypothetical protein
MKTRSSSFNVFSIRPSFDGKRVLTPRWGTSASSVEDLKKSGYS